MEPYPYLNHPNLHQTSQQHCLNLNNTYSEFNHVTSRNICKYHFSSSGCKFGGYCRYSHVSNSMQNIPLTTNSIENQKKTDINLCKYYGSERGCRSGDKCKYDHSNPNSVPICEFFTSIYGCSYGDQCQYRHKLIKTDNPTNIIRNDAIEFFKSGISLEFKSRIFILKHPEEPTPKIKLINLYDYRYNMDNELEAIVSSGEHDHIVYISRVDIDDSSIKIIPSNHDASSFLTTHCVIYPKDKSVEHTQVNIVRTLNDDNYARRHNAKCTELKAGNLRRAITIFYTKQPHVSTPKVDDISSIKYEVGEKVDYNYNGWKNATIIHVNHELRQIEIQFEGSMVNKRSVNKFDERLAASHSYTLCETELPPPNMSKSMYSHSNQAIYYKHNKNGYILLNAYQDGCIYRYDINCKKWERYIEYPQGIDSANYADICFDEEKYYLYILTSNDCLCKINVLTKKCDKKECVVPAGSYNQRYYRYLSYIPSPKKELHLVSSFHYERNIRHFKLVPNDAKIEVIEQEEEKVDDIEEEMAIDTTLWSNLQSILIAKRWNIAFDKITNKTKFTELNWNITRIWRGHDKRCFGFDHFLFVISDNKLWCIDMFIGKAYQSKKPAQGCLGFDNINVAKTDDNYLHIINGEVLNKIGWNLNYKYPTPHIRISVLDLVPKELKDLYNPLLIYGWVRIIQMNENTINCVSTDLMHLIMRYYSSLMY